MLTLEQLAKLEAKARELADLVLLELDTAKWPSMASKEGRGDRVWVKKNVSASLVLIDQIQRVLRAQPLEAPPEVPGSRDGETAEEALIREAEERADAMSGRAGRATPH